VEAVQWVQTTALPSQIDPSVRMAVALVQQQEQQQQQTQARAHLQAQSIAYPSL
jgi:hypothetical protein